MALVKKPLASAAPEINFGDYGFYVAGGGMPEGNYALEFMTQMFQATNQTTGVAKGPARLGVMVKAHPLDGGEPRNQFYSMGSKSHESFQPNPDTGKGLVAVPDGPGASNLNNSTNWAYFLKSLYDSGMPQGIFRNDLSVLDGIHVHLHSIPEPEDRKGFQNSKTSEVDGEPRKAGTISVVSEILEGGAPWEGGGGIPDPAAAKAPVAKAGAVKPVAKVAPKVAAKAAPVAVATEGLTEEELLDLATQGLTTVLEASPDGIGTLLARTGVFKAIKAAADDETASAVLAAHFATDEAMGEVAAALGYKVAGKKIVPA